ncbi:MAG: lipoate--protein ligase [Bacteroides sp.]|nr:lipoate--protein ligase [Bacteroides sp.]
MRYLKNPNTDPYYNMAFDEYCLENLAIDEPVFYLWQNRPAVIVGLNQEVNTEVNLEYLEKNGIALVRRVTGGGAVYHDLGNLNYTIVGPSEDLERDYPEYAGLMMKALQKLGVPTTLSGRNDILVEGRKVSGFAKRVCKNRLMVHGTLLYKVDLDVLTQVLNPSATKLQSKGIASVRSRVANLCDYLPEIQDIQSLSQRLEEILSCNYSDSECKLSDADLANIQHLSDEKFARWEWNYGRSPKATLTHSARLACGTVEIHLTLAENRISSCRFGGDFLGNLPATDLESALQGVVYNTESIRERLSSFTISNYFDGVAVDDLVSMMF